MRLNYLDRCITMLLRKLHLSISFEAPQSDQYQSDYQTKTGGKRGPVNVFHLINHHKFLIRSAAETTFVSLTP